MSRANLNCCRMQVAVLLLVCLITAPIAWADDYFHLFHALQGTQEEGCPSSKTEESYGGNTTDDPEAQHACSCLVCIFAIGKTNAGIPLPLKILWGVDPHSVATLKPSFFSEIYHPPLA